MPRSRSRSYWCGSKPITSRVYNSTLGMWLRVVAFPTGAVDLQWTADRDAATQMESFAADTTALALKIIADANGLGWEAVYAEPVTK